MHEDSDLSDGFRLGPWIILPQNGEVTNGAETYRLEPKVMDVLTTLARHEGTLVSKQQIVDEVWAGRPVTDEVIARCISALRAHLGDDHKSPRFIETLPKRGYRLITPVLPVSPVSEESEVQAPRGRRPLALVLSAAALVLAAVAVFFVLRPPSPVAPPEDFRSVAVLPFTNLSAAPDQYLADGVTEELTYALTQLPNLKVAARTSAFQFRDTSLDVREIGRRIEVDGIIEGSVRREDNLLRVTAQLVDTRSGYQLWAVTFDGSVEDVFRLQRQVAERVRDSIERGERRSNVPAVTEPASFAAYDLYLRGRYALNRRGVDSLRRAIDLFQQAIARDPGYGPAYLELANAQLLLPSYSGENSAPMYEAAVRTVTRGVQADPSIAMAAAAVHGYIHNKRGEWLEADRAYQSALEARQVESTTHQWYSNMLASVGRLDAALQQAERARRLDPLSPVVMSRLAMTSLWANDNEAAAAQFEVANELGIESRLHVATQLLLMIRQGRLEEARRLSAGAAGAAMPAWFGRLLDCLGDGENCDAIAGELGADTAASPRVRLIAWALLGDFDRVAQVAELLETDIGAFETELLFIAELEPYRRRPEFRRLIDSIGIGTYWAQTGCRWSEAGVSCGS